MNRSAHHEDLSREDAVPTSSDRSFGVVFSGFFLLVALWPVIHGRSLRVWALGVSLVFLMVAGLYPAALRPLNRLWGRIGHLLQRTVNPVVLGVLFFLVITPIGLLVRLRGQSSIKLTFDSEALTYWVTRKPPGPAPDTMKHQF